MSLEKLIACIRRNRTYLVTAHTNVEGDAIGSELAFYGLLKACGRRAVIINEDSVPAEYAFLPGASGIKEYRETFRKTKFDCFVTLDCSDMSRCGKVSRMKAQAACIVNIDHHVSNRRFGDVNWVEPGASSTCEMVYKLYKRLRVPIDRASAVSLYTGILTDTGSFRYSSTSSLTHAAVAELMRHRFDIVRIYKSIYENIPLGDIRLLIDVLPTLKSDLRGRVVWFQIRRKLLAAKSMTFDISEYLLSLARAIKGVEVALLFKEGLDSENEIRVNLRSQSKVDVNKIARFFGGGGHRTASSFLTKGKLDQVEKMVLSKVRESFGCR